MSNCPTNEPVANIDRATGFDAWEQRENKAFQLLPYLLLGIAVVISLLQWDSQFRPRVSLLLAVVAAAWTWWFMTRHPSWMESRPRLMVLFYLGFLGLAAGMIADAPWYAVYAWIGFIHSFECLRGRWRFLGMAACAMLMASAQLGGFAKIATVGVATWAAIVLINFVVAGGFTYFGSLSSEQNVKRKRALAELEQTNAQLQEALTENAGLHAQLVTQAREAGARDERERLAAEIHDTLAQGFTGIITQLQAAEQCAANRVLWQRHLDIAAALARENLAEARRSVRAMTPEPLDATPLPEALDELAQRWSARSSVDVQFTTTGTVRPMHPELEATLVRVTQEALTNVDKHAQAQRVGLTLSYMEDLVTLDVRDDGIGFDVGRTPEHAFGLDGMRRRVQRLAGTLSVESEPTAGTAISASLPALELPAQTPPLTADAMLPVARQDDAEAGR